MIKKITFLTLFSAFSLTLTGQVFFNRAYFNDSLNSKYGSANAVIQTSDGNFFVAGTSQYYDRATALKLNSQGDTIWSFSAWESACVGQVINSVLEATDGDFVIGGDYYNFLIQDWAGFLIKINSETGAVIWQREIGEIGKSERILSIKETADKGYVLSGDVYFLDSSGVSPFYNVDALIVKTDSLGLTELTNTFGGADSQDANSIELTDDGGFILLGSSYSNTSSLSSIYAVKTDNLGNMLWQKFYGGNFDNRGWNICKLQDGNYVVVGGSNYAVDSTGSYIAKIDPDGFILWEKNLKGTKLYQDFQDVDQLPNGNIVACGNTFKDNTGNRIRGVLKAFNPIDGALVWEKQYRYKVVDKAQNVFYNIDVCNDGGMILSGNFTNLNNYPISNPSYFWVVKTDCKGSFIQWGNSCSQAGIDELEDESSPTWFTLYPNPTTSNFSVQCTLPNNSKNNKISIFDAMGKLMQIVPISAFSNADVEIDASGFAKGVYSIVLSSDKQILQTQKLVRME